MDSKYYIKALTDNETLSLLKDKKFNTLHPVKCDKCGNTTDFRQKLYRVDTKPKKIDEDERQFFLRHHMKQNYNFDLGFIKNWLGPATYDEYFHGHYRDTMTTALYLNDRAAAHGEQVKFARVGLGPLANKFNIENKSAHDALQDCVVTAAVYKKLCQQGLLG